MTEVELFRLLQRLGIDRGNLRALAVLPLVEVAWADGEVTPRERDRIERAARELALSPEGWMLLTDWLAHAPSPAALHASRLALSRLARDELPQRPQPSLPAQ